ncbi:MAG: NAD-dependent succinate-semialdehyde dehydrogenase [Ignavibacteriaceae bacterium]|nr:NAD-dependent succinate-semialdehyde dehydrogenase [Ignavibacteriaceae bacterium]
MIKSFNPATEEEIKSYTAMGKDETDRIIINADNSFDIWKRTSFSLRAERMKAAGKVLRQRRESLSILMTAEMGKPITQSRSEIDKCAFVCYYYAENAERFLQDETVETDATKSFITYQPLGVILAIMPWNFPFWQVFRFAAPNIMAGNAGILKHSSNVTGCGLAIENIFREAGFPENLFRTLIIDSCKVGDIIKNDRIKGVTLTGSTAAGKSVAAIAGSVIKKSVLELGGSDPYIILEDAELEKAAEICVNSRLINSGQSCIAAKRFIIVNEVYRKFEDLFVEKMKSKVMGDPMKEDTIVGPQARNDLRAGLHEQVIKSVRSGAKVIIGGKIPDNKGAFYPPTVLTNVEPEMPAYKEELFGPVACLIRVKNEADAIRIANDSVFGLGGAVFTQDIARGERIAREELNAGNCFVNESVKSDPRLPFGGVKESGYGRELSVSGIKEFVNIKTVYRK